MCEFNCIACDLWVDDPIYFYDNIRFMNFLNKAFSKFQLTWKIKRARKFMNVHDNIFNFCIKPYYVDESPIFILDKDMLSLVPLFID